ESSVRHSSKARHVAVHGRQSEPSLSKAELRRCKGLSRHQLRRNKKCEAALKRERAATAEKRHPAKTMSKAELRRCHAMSYRQLLRHRDCGTYCNPSLTKESMRSMALATSPSASTRLRPSPGKRPGITRSVIATEAFTVGSGRFHTVRFQPAFGPFTSPKPLAIRPANRPGPPAGAASTACRSRHI